MRWMIVVPALLGLASQGCIIDAYGPVYTESEQETVIVHEEEPEAEPVETVIVVEEPVLTVDTHWPVPSAVLDILAPSVQGYFTPEDARYGDFLYYQDTPRGHDNHPSYVRGDFNGDWNTDHALLFTREIGDHCAWTIDTRLLVVLSCHGGYDFALDLELGSVTGDCGYAVEEYWSLCKMPAGVHVYETYCDNVVIEEEVFLEDDAFLLTSLATGEQDLIYAIDHEVYYMPWTPATLAKRPAKPGRTAKAAPWKDTLRKRVIPSSGKPNRSPDHG
jgi:hypothetical protein